MSAASKSKKRSWIASSFDDDDFSTTTSNDTKLGAPTIYKKLKGISKSSKNPSLWSGEFVNKDRLAVHKKKAEEVEKWLINALTGVPGHRVLLLTGPAGCGKTACVRALAEDMTVVVKEWINPSSVYTNNSNWESRPWVPGDQVSESGAATLFREYVSRVNKYGSVTTVTTNPSNRDYNGQLLLVEDLPNVFYREPALLQDIIRRYVLCGRTPAVFIMSDAPQLEHSSTRLFPPNFCSAVGVTIIQFNSVATTLMTKALSEVCRRHDVPVSTELITCITEAASGDLRSATNALQFSLDFSDTTKNILLAPSKKKSRRKMANTDDISPAVATSTNAKDSALPLFRALGKVLYCKRSDSPAAPLPPHLRQEERAPATADPEVLLDTCYLTPPTFAAFLHQNYTPFMKSVAGASTALQYLCDADLILSQWADGEKLWSYGSVAARGVMHATGVDSGSEVSKISTFRPLVSPAFNDVTRTASGFLERVRSKFPTGSLHDLTSIILPYSSIIDPYKFGGLASELGRMAESGRVKQLQCHFSEHSREESVSEPIDYDDTIEEVSD
ncbi:cell cycle checkpoint protein RAD17-like isoform X2 [Hyalella azteca]|uniref:Cell cycle checkpoint protein RAD17-like isoform X2 n=1 Tax=Hyalella azteca TaxID=294128 RepID=A0A8B7NWT0_HYAAZ|nr:cell cycle checkpoint protein RAD17-like isoform X2 [Hyalella azteca]